MGRFAVILVHSTSHAIHAERVLKRAGIEVRLIPTPRHLSSDCGSALRFELTEQAECERLLAAARVPIDRLELMDE